MGAYQTLIQAEPSLVNYWRLDDTSGTSAVDSKGTYTGTYSTTKTLAVGSAIDGTCVTFGTGTVTATPTGTLDAPYTVEFWLKTTTTGSVFSTRSGGNYLDIQVQSNNLHGDIGTGPGWLDTSADGAFTGLQDGNWHHVVYSVGLTESTIYVDGVPRRQATLSGTARLWANTTTIVFGGFACTLDEFAVYGTALDNPTVRNHYRTGLALPAYVQHATAGLPGVGLVGGRARGRSPRGLFVACGLGSVPADAISGSVPIYAGGSAPPTLVGSPFGPALRFGPTSQHLTYSKVGTLVRLGPWTAFAVFRLNSVANLTINRVGIVSTGNSAVSGNNSYALEVIRSGTASFPLGVLNGSTDVSSGINAMPLLGDWLAVAAAWDGKSAHTFYVLDYDTSTYQSAAVTSAVSWTAVNSNPSIGQVASGSAPEADIAVAGFDTKVWSAGDFAAFAADPFNMVRPTLNAALKFAGVTTLAAWPAALLPAM